MTAGMFMTEKSKFIPLAIVLLFSIGCTDSPTALNTGKTIARVNGQPITDVQLRDSIQSEELPVGMNEEFAARIALEKVINQQLLANRATELNLDRTPEVLTALERVRRQVLAEAYLRQQLNEAQKITEDSLKKYYDENPALYKKRAVYTFREFIIAPGVEAGKLNQAIVKSKNDKSFRRWLEKQKIINKHRVVTEASENLSHILLPALQNLSVNKGAVFQSNQGLSVIWLQQVIDKPVSYEQAKGDILRKLVKLRRDRITRESIGHLRKTSHVEYLPPFKREDVPEANAEAKAPAAAKTQAE